MASNKDGKDAKRFYRGKSLRLPKHDYSWTRAYFVTVCSVTRDPIFEIPQLHSILQETWHALPKRFPGVTLDAFVIMPDHIHGLLWLNGLVPHPPTLGRVIGAYKSLTAVAWFDHCKATGINGGGSFWLSRFHERVMRDNNEVAIYTGVTFGRTPKNWKDGNTNGSREQFDIFFPARTLSYHSRGGGGCGEGWGPLRSPFSPSRFVSWV